MKSNQQKGRAFEKEVAAKLQAKEVPGSGNQPFNKLDVQGSSFIVSCKWTKKASITLSNDSLREAERASHGPGGTGSTPLLVTRVMGAEEGAQQRMYVTLDVDDFIALLQEKKKLFTEDKTQAKYTQANIPSLFRQTQEDA